MQITEIQFMTGLSDLTDREIAKTPIGELERHAVARVIATRAMRARALLGPLADADGKLFTAVELANMSDLDAIDFADAFNLDLDAQPTVCFSRRIHPAHGTCKGLDADTLFDRTQDAAL